MFNTFCFLALYPNIHQMTKVFFVLSGLFRIAQGYSIPQWQNHHKPSCNLGIVVKQLDIYEIVRK